MEREKKENIMQIVDFVNFERDSSGFFINADIYYD